MRIGVLGTGMVGQAIAGKLVSLGHEVKMGSRVAGNEKAKEFVSKAGPDASEGTFSEAAAFGEMVFNCTKGDASLEALNAAGADNLAGKVLVDVSNPLDFSNGFPPTLTVVNTSSLAEQIQDSFPETRVVKALNTLNASLMVDPSLVPGEHDIFICGNDDGAKAEVVKLLESFGWKTIHDLGDVTMARGTEMLLPLWVRLYAKFQSPNFNFHIAKA